MTALLDGRLDPIAVSVPPDDLVAVRRAPALPSPAIGHTPENAAAQEHNEQDADHAAVSSRSRSGTMGIFLPGPPR